MELVPRTVRAGVLSVAALLSLAACAGANASGATPVAALDSASASVNASPTDPVDLSSIECPASVDSLAALVISHQVPQVTDRAGAATALLPAGHVLQIVQCAGGGTDYPTVARTVHTSPDPVTAAYSKGLPETPAPNYTGWDMETQTSPAYTLTYVEYASGPNVEFVTGPVNPLSPHAESGTYPMFGTNGVANCTVDNGSGEAPWKCA